MSVFFTVDENNVVDFMHFKPEKLPPDFLAKGKLTESIPVFEEIEGKIRITKYEVEKGFYPVYIDRPLTKEEIMQNEINNLKMMVADLGLQVGGGL